MCATFPPKALNIHSLPKTVRDIIKQGKLTNTYVQGFGSGSGSGRIRCFCMNPDPDPVFKFSGSGPGSGFSQDSGKLQKGL